MAKPKAAKTRKIRAAKSKVEESTVVASNVAKHEVHQNKDNTKQIVGLLLNVLILPGLGSIIGGRIWAGVAQLCIFFGSLFFGAILIFTIIGAIIGIPLIIFGTVAAWIWGLVTGIQMVTEK